MSGKKTKTRTRTARKPAKQGSLPFEILKFLFNSTSTLAIAIGEFVGRNPVITGGATAFVVVMGFVSANALWYQPEAHNHVFFQTRSDFTFKPTPVPRLPGAATSDKESTINLDDLSQDQTASIKPESPAQATSEVKKTTLDLKELSGSIDDRLPALAPNADLEIARLQYRLTELGIYKGSIDGFTGPQTRDAMERWEALQAKTAPQQAQQQPVQAVQFAPSVDASNVVIPKPRPQNASVRIEQSVTKPTPLPVVMKPSTPTPPAAVKPTPAVNVSAPQPNKISPQDIVRVQAGLKAFGNSRVPVDGVANKATQDAVREFRKLFGLPISGEIDGTLISKMREIGLISG